MYITTAAYEKLTEQEQAKVGTIIDNGLEEGILEIKELGDLHRAMDHIILEEDLNGYTDEGYKRRITDIRKDKDGGYCLYDPLDNFYTGDKMLSFETDPSLTLEEYATVLEEELLIDPAEISDAIYEYKQFNKED